ncbi:hypothetical protein OUZ56_011461 [Daphnia magna]|uniref:Coatomer subunit zeta n=2 Tax=Daphnia magna TaxID=35525 RepID=A0ABQ9Z079_9CRUS|nr:hypothetical protein OUZ56_011461 [Daphnia magna]
MLVKPVAIDIVSELLLHLRLCIKDLAHFRISCVGNPYSKMDNHVLEPSLYVIKGIAILDNDGKRILAKYYDPNTLSTAKEQKVFEKNLFNKTHRANTEIIMLENMTCVYKSNVDLYFYVMGSNHENELILVSVLNCLYDSISQILRKNVEKRSLMENLDVVMLALDEICDSGIILESDPTAISYRVALRNDDIPIGEQTVAQVLQSAKEQLKWSLLK